MKIAYLDCPSGIAGDMMLAALIDAGVPAERISDAIRSLGIEGVELVVEETKRKGFRGLHVEVVHPAEHAHRHLHHIDAMIDASETLTPRQKDLAKRIFLKVGEAEAKVHGTTLQKVHFHEVGAVDSIADIVGTAVGWDLLEVDRVVCSPIPTGTGFIEIAHGRCSVPAPATAEILRGIPLQTSDVPYELTTPTGAAIVATVVDQFGPLPSLRIEKIGYGCGTRELENQPNLLRLVIGTATDNPALLEQAWVLETQVDDVTGEVLGHTAERLLEKGALDVYTTAVQMKKGRPGVKITVLCDFPLIGRLESILFRETGTLGIRRFPVSRQRLTREPLTVQTPMGQVLGKMATVEGGRPVFSPEFEVCRAIAKDQGVPLREVYDLARRAFEEQRP